MLHPGEPISQIGPPEKLPPPQIHSKFRSTSESREIVWHEILVKQPKGNSTCLSILLQTSQRVKLIHSLIFLILNLLDETPNNRAKHIEKVSFPPGTKAGDASKWELVFAEVTLSKVKHVQSEWPR